MLEKQAVKIYRKNNYVIEIQKSKKGTDIIEFYIYNVNYGIKLNMFALELDFDNDGEIIEMINNNIKEYIKIYKRDFED
jgi:hypothetical protein